MNELYFSDLGITMYTIPSDEGHRKGEGRGGGEDVLYWLGLYNQITLKAIFKKN